MRGILKIIFMLIFALSLVFCTTPQEPGATETEESAIISIKKDGVKIDLNATIEFGALTLGDTPQVIDFYITNEGQKNLEIFGDIVVDSDQFEIIAPENTILEPGISVKFSVKFNPQAPGTNIQGKVTISHNGELRAASDFSFNVQGSATLSPMGIIKVFKFVYNSSTQQMEPILVSSGDNFSFNQTDQIQYLCLKNTGNAPLNVQNINLSNNENNAFSLIFPEQFPVLPYDLAEDPTLSEPAKSMCFQVKFAGSAQESALLQVGSGDENSPFQLNLVSALKPDIIVIGSIPIPSGTISQNSQSKYDFGKVINGFTKDVTFQIYNNGTTTLNITGNIAINPGTPFTLMTTFSEEDKIIAPGQSRYFVVRFNPESDAGVKSYQGVIAIPSNDPDTSSYTFTLLGNTESTNPVIEVYKGTTKLDSINPVDFKEAARGVSKKLVFSIKSAGNCPLVLTGDPKVTIDNTDFKVSSTITATSITTSIDFEIEFDPQTQGNKTAVVSIPSNATVTPFTFKLKGKGYRTVDGDGKVGIQNSMVVQGDNIYIAYKDILNGQLKLAKSIDKGQSWSLEVVDSGLGDNKNPIKMGIYNNDLFIVYNGENGTRVKLAKYTNISQSWSTQILDQIEGTSGRQVDLEIDGNGILYIVYSYYSSVDHTLGVKFIKSADGGSSWVSQQRIISANFYSLKSVGIEVAGQDIYVIFGRYENSWDSTGVFLLVRSHDGGTTWDQSDVSQMPAVGGGENLGTFDFIKKGDTLYLARIHNNDVMVESSNINIVVGGTVSSNDAYTTATFVSGLYGISMRIGDNGDIYLVAPHVYYNSSGNTYGLYFFKYSGGSWNRKWIYLPQEGYYPAFSFSGSEMYISYQYNYAEKLGFVHSTDAGVNWQ